MALINKLSAIGDAIRAKTGKADKLSLDQMATEIAEMETGGGGYGVNGLIARTEPSGDLVHTDPNVTNINHNQFQNCTEITSFSSDYIETISAYAFDACKKLKNVNMTKLTNLSQSAFRNCSALESANISGVTNVNAATCFQGCSSLKSISLPNANTATGMTMFQYCNSLEFADMGFVTNLNSYLFTGCKKLKTLVLRNTTLVPLVNGNAIDGQFADNGTGGTVYVPSALIESYKTATNWSTLYAAGNCNFVALEGSEYE